VRRGLAAAGVAAALAAVSPAPAAEPGDAAKPGAYCPLPEAGERPRCLDPAVERYGEFFTALDEGSLDDADAARLEEELARAEGSPASYLALSSLSYGYFRLARKAAKDPAADPAVVTRLARWNELLGRAYEASRDPAYREAVEAAAEDLHARARGVSMECVGAQGHATRCDATEMALRRLRMGREAAGLRGALSRLVDRVFGAGE